MKKIGTIELLNDRVYPIDAAGAPHNHSGVMTDVSVPPGVYDLYEDSYGIRFWMMTGKVVENIAFRLGEGLFRMGSDSESEVEVTFPSVRYDERMWEEFLNHPVCVEGGINQRLRITVEAGEK